MPDQAADQPISCPIEGTLMSRMEIDDIYVDRCPDCGGIWLDPGELWALLHGGRRAKKQIDAAEAIGGEEPDTRPTPLLCPRDHQRMSVHHDPVQTHIEYDLCPKCGGVFLDAGELGDLTQTTLMERLKGLLG